MRSQAFGLNTRGMRPHKPAGSSAAAIRRIDRPADGGPVLLVSFHAMNDRITFRLGSLLGPLADYCEKHGTTPSEAIRLALSRLLRVEAPEMTPGNPDIGEQAEAGAAARWKRKKGRK